MSKYAPAPEYSKPWLQTKPWLDSQPWVQNLPALFEGETTIEHIIYAAQQQLKASWPAEAEQRRQREHERAEEQRELDEIKANENRTEPIIVLLPPKTGPVAPVPVPDSADTSEADKPAAESADEPVDSSSSEQFEAEIEQQPATTRPVGLSHGFDDDEASWEGTGAEADLDMD